MNNELRPKFLMGQPSGIFGNNRFKLLAHNIRAIRPATPFLGSGFSRRGEAEGVHTCACFDGSPSNIILSVACRRDDDALYANCTLEAELALLKQLPEPSNVIRKKVSVAKV